MKPKIVLVAMVETPFGSFKLGQKVLYEVYPHGKELKGIICAHGIQSIEDTAVKFINEEISTFAHYEDAQIANIIPV
jgi:hypothetical protein